MLVTTEGLGEDICKHIVRLEEFQCDLWCRAVGVIDKFSNKVVLDIYMLRPGVVLGVPSERDASLVVGVNPGDSPNRTILVALQFVKEAL